MPKFIGQKIENSTRIQDNASEHPDRIRITYAQACMLPACEVLCSMDTMDRGSRGSYAKRWYRWFASPAAILAGRGTANMIARATRYGKVGTV